MYHRLRITRYGLFASSRKVEKVEYHWQAGEEQANRILSDGMVKQS